LDRQPPPPAHPFPSCFALYGGDQGGAPAATSCFLVQQCGGGSLPLPSVARHAPLGRGGEGDGGALIVKPEAVWRLHGFSVVETDLPSPLHATMLLAPPL
ncbi:hypothetical protein EJB05_37439, partial [Eragrostis curvula]